MRTRLLDQRVPAARADVVDDGAHRVEQGLVIAPARPRQRGVARRRVAPVEPLDHSIIFSIGITRIADAPARLQLFQRLPEHRFLAHRLDRIVARPADQRHHRRRFRAGQDLR